MNQHGRDPGADLSFVAPGIVHLLGNALFRVQGHAQLLPAVDANSHRERQAILEAVDRAGQAVQMLHWLLGEGSAQPTLAGPLQERLAECLRVPLRERGLRLEIACSSNEVPVAVDGGLFLRGLLAALRSMVGRAVAGCGGVVRIDLIAQQADGVRVRLDLLPQPALLPFPLDAVACADQLNRELGPAGIAATALPGATALLLAFPGQGDGILPGSSRQLDPLV